MLNDVVDFVYNFFQKSKNITTLFYLNKIYNLSDIYFILQLGYYDESLDYVKKNQISIAEYRTLSSETKMTLSNINIKDFILSGHISFIKYIELSKDIKSLLAFSDSIRRLIIKDYNNLEKIKKLNSYQVVELGNVYISSYFFSDKPINLEQYAQLHDYAIRGLESRPISKLFQLGFLNIDIYLKLKPYHIEALEQQFDNNNTGNIFNLLSKRHIKIQTFSKLSELMIEGLKNEYIFKLIENGNIKINKYQRLKNVNIKRLINNAREIYLNNSPIIDYLHNAKKFHKKNNHILTDNVFDKRNSLVANVHKKVSL